MTFEKLPGNNPAEEKTLAPYEKPNFTEPELEHSRADLPVSPENPLDTSQVTEKLFWAPMTSLILI